MSNELLYFLFGLSVGLLIKSMITNIIAKLFFKIFDYPDIKKRFLKEITKQFEIDLSKPDNIVPDPPHEGRMPIPPRPVNYI